MIHYIWTYPQRRQPLDVGQTGGRSSYGRIFLNITKIYKYNFVALSCEYVKLHCLYLCLMFIQGAFLSLITVYGAFLSHITDHQAFLGHTVPIFRENLTLMNE